MWANILVYSHKNLDDQSVFWKNYRTNTHLKVVSIPTCDEAANATTLLASNVSSSSGQEFVSCPLDGCEFSAGALRGVAFIWLKDNLNTRNRKSHTVHANYLKGNVAKMEALRRHGYWITGHPSLTCNPFNLNF